MEYFKLTIFGLVVFILMYLVGIEIYDLLIYVYHILDKFMWTFFAGVIAVYLTIVLIQAIFKASVLLGMGIFLLGGIVVLYVRGEL